MTAVQAATATAAAAAAAPARSRSWSAVAVVATTVVWPGLGLLGESYLLFSVGTLPPLWNRLFDDDGGGSGNGLSLAQWYHRLALSAIGGVLLGMLVLGGLADVVGRRAGSIGTAAAMLAGAAALLTLVVAGASAAAAGGGAQQQQAAAPLLFRRLAAAHFVFGVGVGGEYPLAAASASEQTMTTATTNASGSSDSTYGYSSSGSGTIRPLQQPQQRAAATGGGGGGAKDATTTTADYNNNAGGGGGGGGEGTAIHGRGADGINHHRGRHVQLVFSMQGVGILLHSLVLTALLYAFSPSTGSNSSTDDGGNGGGNNNNNNHNGGNGGGGAAGRYYYTAAALWRTWQILYATGAAVLAVVLATRVWHLKESAAWTAATATATTTTTYPTTAATTTTTTTATPAVQRDRVVAAAGAVPLRPVTTGGHGHDDDETAGGVDDKGTDTNGRPAAPFRRDNVPRHDDNDDDEAYHHRTTDNGTVAFHDGINSKGHSTNKYVLLVKHYGVRLCAVSASWFLWDVAFYGNKLFQSSFLLALTGSNNNDQTTDATLLLHYAAASTLNAAVALCGYWTAALIVDDPRLGRRRLQQWGFVLTGGLFVGVGLWFERLPAAVLVALYLASSYAGQVGPNATTFVLPAEIFPTALRSVCHGVAAASGKLGALAATMVFTAVRHDRDMFLLSGYASFLAAVVTFCFIPETVGLDLHENDEHWQALLRGQPPRYKDPAFLSLYERRQQNRRRNGGDGGGITTNVANDYAVFA